MSRSATTSYDKAFTGATSCDPLALLPTFNGNPMVPNITTTYQLSGGLIYTPRNVGLPNGKNALTYVVQNLGVNPLYVEMVTCHVGASFATSSLVSLGFSPYLYSGESLKVDSTNGDNTSSASGTLDPGGYMSIVLHSSATFSFGYTGIQSRFTAYPPGLPNSPTLAVSNPSNVVATAANVMSVHQSQTGYQTNPWLLTFNGFTAAQWVGPNSQTLSGAQSVSGAEGVLFYNSGNGTTYYTAIYGGAYATSSQTNYYSPYAIPSPDTGAGVGYVNGSVQVYSDSQKIKFASPVLFTFVIGTYGISGSGATYTTSAALFSAVSALGQGFFNYNEVSGRLSFVVAG